jgi:GNAT superfamily N-acetyltransferase
VDKPPAYSTSLWTAPAGCVACPPLPGIRKPYRMLDGTVLLDVQQLIPLPEAATFQTQFGVKKQAERQSQSTRNELRLKFWQALLEYAKTKTELHANRSPSYDGWISGSIGRGGFSLTYSTRRTDSQVELWISLGSGQTARNKAAFKALEAKKAEIEGDFGNALEWQELPEGEGCRIRYVMEGGYRSPQEQWPAIHSRLTNAMTRLVRAVKWRQPPRRSPLRVGRISMMLVGKRHRRQGVATVLLEHCVAHLREQGLVPVLDAHALAQGRTRRGFYRRGRTCGDDSARPARGQLAGASCARRERLGAARIALLRWLEVPKLAVVVMEADGRWNIDRKEPAPLVCNGDSRKYKSVTTRTHTADHVVDQWRGGASSHFQRGARCSLPEVA